MTQFLSRLFRAVTTSTHRRHLDQQRHRLAAYRAPTLETLEDRTLLASTPIGSVDLLTKTSIAGWAMNSDDGPSAVNVEITINGTKSTVNANLSRLDLATPLGSPYHAYLFPMPTLAPGVSNILIEAVSTSTGARVTLKKATLTNNSPAGNVEVFTGTRIAGWIADRDSANPINVKIDVDGIEVTNTATNVSRPDVAAVYSVSTAGFDISGSFAGHVVEVYAIDNPSNQKVLIYTNNKKPIGSIDWSDGKVLAGWAFDPDNKSIPVKIRVDIDGVTLPGTPADAALTRNDLQAVYGTTNHGYGLVIPGLTPGDHTITVYAIDAQATSQAPVLIGTSKVTNKPPVGNVEVVNANVVSGWALDPDIGNTGSPVKVYVDDTLFATVTANNYRPDLVPYYKSANHGFSVDLSTLPAGSHSITVTVQDNRTSDESDVVIFDDFINNTAPKGSVDMVTNGKIYGWAFDADAPGQGIDVDIYVDGVYATTTNASLGRGDVDSFLGSPNHAFAVDLPSMTFGTHKIDVYAAESQGNVSVLIGSKSVTNNRPIGNLDVANTTTLAGWAVDPDRIGVSIDIKVYINNVLVATVTANNARPDLLGKAPMSGSSFNAYGFMVSLPTLSSGRNQIDVYAVDKNNSMTSPLGSRVITV